jgi:hypothetical protein
MPQTGLRLSGAPDQCVEIPVGVSRRMNHGEGSAIELAALHQRSAPNPLDPIVDVGAPQEIGHGVGVAEGSPAEERLEQPDLGSDSPEELLELREAALDISYEHRLHDREL